MLAHFNDTVFKTDSQAHLAIWEGEVNASETCDFGGLSLFPETFAAVIDAISPIRQTVAKQVLLDHLQVLDLSLFIDVKYKLRTLEDTYSKVI